MTIVINNRVALPIVKFSFLNNRMSMSGKRVLVSVKINKHKHNRIKKIKNGLANRSFNAKIKLLMHKAKNSVPK